MTTFIIAFAVFALALLGLSLGVILNRRPIKGSCGGLSQIAGVESDCGGACRAGGEVSDHHCPRRKSQAPTDTRIDRHMSS